MARHSNSTRRRQAVAFRLSPLTRAVAAAIAATGAAAPVYGQEMIEEIVVTATKRAESVKDVPLAITVLTGDFTEKRNLNDVKDLVSFSPGVSGNSKDSFIDAISIRGIRTQDFGVGGDPSAAFFKDELYEGRNGSAVTSLYDMERSEVLRGPQGFLFGRNSIGGAFSMHTRRARVGEGGGRLSLDVGENDHVVGEGAINIPLTDQLATRLAGYYSNEDGYVKNAFGGDRLIEHDKWALRWSTAYQTERLSVDTTVEYESRDQSGSVYRAINEGDTWDALETALGPIDLAGGKYDADSDITWGDADDADITTLEARIEYDLDFATFTSITGYKDHDYYYSEDYDGTPLSISNYQQDQEGDYFQQELRLTSDTDSALSWYGGVSYYREKIDTLFAFRGREDFFCQYYGYAYNSMAFTGCADLYNYYGSPFTSSADGHLSETSRIKGTYTGWSTYVDLNYAFTDQFDVGVGVRYTDDEKDFSLNVPTPESELGPYWAYGFSTDGYVSETKSWDDVQTRVVARFRPTDNATFWGSYTEGFKSGGFGSFALEDSDGIGVGGGFTDASQADGFRPNAFDPETADAWEIGYNGSLLDKAASVSLTAFYYEYQDLQVVVFDGGASTVKNVGTVDSWGVEGSVNAALGPYLDLYVALSYLDSEADGLEDICGLADPLGCEGSSLFWAPEWTGAFVVDGHYPLSQGNALTGAFEIFWESERGGGWEGLSETKIDSFAEATVRVGYESAANWSLEAYVENVFDENTWDGLNNNGGVVPSHFFGPLRPRFFGVRFNWEWD